MIDFKHFKEGDTFRIQLNHLVNSNRYPESIYCIFKSCSYLGDSDYVDELIIDQIIEIEQYLNKEEFQTVERKFKNLGRKVISIHYRMHE
jgi:hypothetical protein